MAAGRPVVNRKGLRTLRVVLGAVARYLFPLISLALIADWFASPRQLRLEDAQPWQATAAIWTEPAVTRQKSAFKYAHIVGSQGQEARIDCATIETLCAELKRRKLDKLAVWVMQPGFFHGTWLVAAKSDDRVVLDIETQNRVYAAARNLHAIFILLSGTVALFGWRRSLVKLFRSTPAVSGTGNPGKR